MVIILTGGGVETGTTPLVAISSSCLKSIIINTKTREFVFEDFYRTRTKMFDHVNKNFARILDVNNLILIVAEKKMHTQNM